MSLPRFKRVETCIFCDSKADSREHAWAEWALKRLRKPSGKIFGHTGGLDFFDPTQKSLRVKCVCVACNVGWMKRLEDAVIPTAGSMMQDIAIYLDRPQQFAIALWAMKSAMVWEFVGGHDRPIFYSNTERHALRLSAIIPPLTSIWLARYGGRNTLFAMANDLGTAESGGQVVKGYVTTLCHGRLAVQVLSVRPNEGEDRTPIVHVKPGPWDQSTVRIWPTDRTASWPPHITFGGNVGVALSHLHSRWGMKADSLGDSLGDALADY